MLRISSAKLLVITLFIVNGSCNSAEEIEDEFKPTKEWQVVRKGQRIPKGLHVRINFETGVTEAKLLDDDEEDDRNKQLLEIPQNSQHNTADDVFESLDDIKRAVKNIKDDFTPGDQKRGNFRSYEDIKRDFESLDLIPKTDAELIGELIKKFVETLKNDGKESLIPILEDLEYLSHQFDNANEFVRMDGFDRVIYKSLNATNNEVKSETLRLLGSLLQNNAKVQIHALETGSIDRLLKILALESDIVVKNRAVYALSCLLRRFPLAQKSFLDNAGLEVFSRVFEMSDLKIKLKIINCLYDLLIEHREAFENTESIDYANRTKQYRQVDLKNKLLQQNWCVKLSSLMSNVYKIDPGDHDSIEKSLTIMNFFLKDCHQSYVGVKNVFKSLEAQYETLAVNDGDGYFENLHKMCVRIVGFLNKHRSEL